ncbi:MAG: acyl-CoA carboxylase subunit epsilon [Pseudonocardiaceae bacterium]
MDQPVLRIVRGDPSDEEVAALTAVVAGLGSPSVPEPPRPRSAWADPASRLRVPLRPGPDAWRGSAMPRPSGGCR